MFWPLCAVQQCPNLKKADELFGLTTCSKKFKKQIRLECLGTKISTCTGYSDTYWLSCWDDGNTLVLSDEMSRNVEKRDKNEQCKHKEQETRIPCCVEQSQVRPQNNEDQAACSSKPFVDHNSNIVRSNSTMKIEVKQPSGIYMNANMVYVSREGIAVSYNDDYDCPAELVPFKSCRQRMSNPKPDAALKVGDTVEAFIKQPDSDISAWQTGKVIEIQDKLAVIKCTYGPINTKLVQLDLCRIAGQTTQLKFALYKTFSIIIPPDMLDYFENPKNYSQLSAVVKDIDVKFVKKDSSIVISAFSEYAIKRAEALADIFLADARMIKSLEEEASNSPNTGKYIEEFVVPDELVGLAIGKKGSNIAAAREIQGVLDISIDKSRESTHGVCDFKVVASTEEAAEDARCKLEFIFGVVSIRREHVGAIVGKAGKNIQQIVNKSGALKVQVGDDHSEPDSCESDYVDFVFTGTRESFVVAETMIELQLEHLAEINELREQIRERNTFQNTEFVSQRHAPSKYAKKRTFKSADIAPIEPRLTIGKSYVITLKGTEKQTGEEIGLSNLEPATKMRLHELLFSIVGVKTGSIAQKIQNHSLTHPRLAHPLNSISQNGANTCPRVERKKPLNVFPSFSEDTKNPASCILQTPSNVKTGSIAQKIQNHSLTHPRLAHPLNSISQNGANTCPRVERKKPLNVFPSFSEDTKNPASCILQTPSQGTPIRDEHNIPMSGTQLKRPCLEAVVMNLGSLDHIKANKPVIKAEEDLNGKIPQPKTRLNSVPFRNERRSDPNSPEIQCMTELNVRRVLKLDMLDDEFLHQICNKQGYNEGTRDYEASFKYFSSTEAKPSRTWSVFGDGNCFLRSVAVAVSGDEDNHLAVRRDVGNYIIKHRESCDRARCWCRLYNTPNELLLESAEDCCDIDRWGSTLHLIAASKLFNIVILTYSQLESGKPSWTVHNPSMQTGTAHSMEQELVYPSVAFQIEDNHCDVVLDVEPPLDVEDSPDMSK
ncbi:KH domain-containing protein [Ditylenchus destructor]|uniref:KH domain-containing protein n=1 Tax=Ditylenchus destructor TaxID=166010 RepID=A0AAD4MX66_9BILA|nr:KH domain-containing protein [Ditylenchus destructor]